MLSIDNLETCVQSIKAENNDQSLCAVTMFFGDQNSLDQYNSGLNPKNKQYKLISVMYLIEQFNEQITLPVLLQICKRICPPDKIDSTYIAEKITNVMEQTSTDMAVLVDVTQFEVNNIIKLFNSVKGIIITEKGECKKFPDVHSLSLICAIPGVGSIMMGSYLYMIKEKNFNRITKKKWDVQLGILDLASSFFNVDGFCAYSKFGFEYDRRFNLYTNCYDPEDGLYNNLPMCVDISQMSTENIIRIVNNEFKLVKDPLCNLKGEKQIIESIIKKINTAKNAIVSDNPLINESKVLRLLTDNVNRFESLEFQNAFNNIIIMRFSPANSKREKIKTFEYLKDSFDKLRNDPETTQKVLHCFIQEEEDIQDNKPAKTTKNSRGGKIKSTRKIKRKTIKTKRKPIKNKRKTRRKPIR